LRGALRELAVGSAFAGGVQHPAVFGAAFARGHLPRRGRGADQHRAGRGPRLAQRQPLVRQTGRAAGTLQSGYLADQLTDQVPGGALHQAMIVRLEGQPIDEHRLVVIDGIESRLLERHLRPVGIHLIGQQHGKTGLGTLPHFGLRHHDGHGVVRGQLGPDGPSRAYR
jgi:hypothetical protein